MIDQFYLKTVNPLVGLDELQLVAHLNDGERGAYAFLQWLFRFVEKRDPVARAVKRRLLAALGKLNWDIKTVDTKDDQEKQAMAAAQATTLRAAYERLKNLRSSLNFLALAELRGFAHVEKIYAGAGDEDPWAITELRPVPQWFWVRDGLYGAWQYNPNAAVGTVTGIPVDPAKFIIREIDDPADEIICKLHVRKEANDADWDGYLEDYGIAPIFIEGPPNVPPEKEAEYQKTAEKIASGARGYIPNGAKVHTVTPGAGSNVFQGRLDYLDGMIVIAGTAGKLTILSERGAGTLAGGAQKDAFDEIAEALAQLVNETMQDGFDADVLERKHPGEPALAYFEFAAVAQADGSKALDDATKAFNAGYEIDQDELSEKSGYALKRIPGAAPISPMEKLAAADAQAPASVQAGAVPPTSPGSPPDVTAVAKPPESAASPAAPPGNAAPLSSEAVKTATAQQLGVTPEYLAPAQMALDHLLAKASDGALSNDDLIASAEDFLASLPGLASKMDTTGMADALDEALQTATEKALHPS